MLSIGCIQPWGRIYRRLKVYTALPKVSLPNGGFWVWEVEGEVVLAFVSVLSDAKITQM
jgi:hypothetical protein